LIDDFAAGIQILWTNRKASKHIPEKAMDFGQMKNKIVLHRGVIVNGCTPHQL